MTVRHRSEPRRGARRLVLALWLCGLAATGRPLAQAAAPPAAALGEGTRASLARLVEEARLAIGAPAISASVVVDGRIAWADGFGEADLEHDVPARADTVYRIASISKPIAATAVMQLVERGLVALDDPVQKYVPAFPRKPEGEIRLRHLLTHTSGIRHYRGNEFDSRQRYDSVVAALGIFKDDPLLFAPGARHEYSTYGYNLLAAVVEHASGQSYGAYLGEHVFGPAGMADSRLERAEDVVRLRARQYTRDTRPDAPLVVRNAAYADLSNKWAGGGVISTAIDLARFDMALNEGRLLRPATLQQMYTSARLTSGQQTGYGLGWMLVRDRHGRSWVGHSGGATGGTTYLLRHPATRVAVVLLCNIDNAPGLQDLALRLADAATGAAPVPTP